MLKLQKSSRWPPKKKPISSMKLKGCEDEAHKIALEKADAEKDLAKKAVRGRSGTARPHGVR